jgi:hypothetical protein
MTPGRVTTAGRSAWHRPVRVGAAVIVALVVSSAAVGCSSGDTDEEVSPSTTAAEEFTTDVSVLPGTDPTAEGARTDITDEACQGADGTWVTSGTVTNSADGPRSYRIYTGFVDSSGETRAVVETDVNDLQPGEARPWEGSAALGGLDDVRCVLRVERVAPTP